MIKYKDLTVERQAASGKAALPSLHGGLLKVTCCAMDALAREAAEANLLVAETCRPLPPCRCSNQRTRLP